MAVPIARQAAAVRFCALSCDPDHIDRRALRDVTSGLPLAARTPYLVGVGLACCPEVAAQFVEAVSRPSSAA